VEAAVNLDVRCVKLAESREGDLVLFYEIGRGKCANYFHLIPPMFMRVLEFLHRPGGLTTFGGR
jgi:hypothetical protein